MDISELRSKVAKWEQHWDYAQTNDAAIRNADPFDGEVTDATLLLDREPERGFTRLLELAGRGSVWAMVCLGGCFLHGRGTPISLRDAEDWYRRAHEAGSERGFLGYVWLLKKRGATDEVAAAYAAGVERDWTSAFSRFAWLRLRNSSSKQERLSLKPMLEKAAQRGSPGAQHLLSDQMMCGRFGLRYVLPGILARVRFARAADSAIDQIDQTQALP